MGGGWGRDGGGAASLLKISVDHAVYRFATQLTRTGLCAAL